MADQVEVIPAGRWFRGVAIGGLLSLILSSTATILTARVANRVESSAECRFDENAEISDVNDSIDLWTARGLAASVRNDQDGVTEALREIDHLSDEFERLISERSEIVERCDN